MGSGIAELSTGVLSGAARGAPGLELRRIRNSRGLKPSQLARLAGHHGLALLLSSSRTHAGGEAGEGGRGAPRAERRRDPGSAPRSERSRERRSGRERRRPYVTQEAVLLALVQAWAH